MPIIKSISGLRATLDGSLNEQLIKEYINALSIVVEDGTIAIGRDGRPSGIWIERIVIDELISNGFNVINLGIVPTPTVQLIVEKYNCTAGISITASHNPENWNGLKFINSKGIFFDAEENKFLWDNLGKKPIKNILKGEIIDNINSRDFHIDIILDNLLIQNLINDIRKRKFKVVIDCVNAAASVIAPKLLREFGCEVVELNCNGSGLFPHNPEPLTENLSELRYNVKELSADLGIAIDPDGDRLVLIDENGEAIGEEKTVCIAIESVLMQKKGNVTVNYSTTNLSKIIAEKYGANFYKAPVGEINVVKKMKETHSIIGGEGSGGVIFPEIHYGRDSLVGIALLLRLLTIKNQSLSELNNSYPKLEMIKTKQEFYGDFDYIKSKIKDKYYNATIIEEDGIVINLGNDWLQIRKSNTEPIIRIIAESSSKEKAQSLINSIKEFV